MATTTSLGPISTPLIDTGHLNVSGNATVDSFDTNSINSGTGDFKGNVTVDSLDTNSINSGTGDFKGNVIVDSLTTNSIDAVYGITAESVTADTANFAACNVDGSPVVTFANIPPTAPTPYPPVGVGVSTGSAWGISIDPANVAMLSEANIFTDGQVVNGKLTAGGMVFYSNVDYVAPPPDMGSLHNNAFGALVLNAPSGPILLNLETGSGGVAFGDGAGHVVASVDNAGNASFNGTVAATGAGLLVFNNAPLVANRAALSFSNNTAYLDAVGADAATGGTFSLRSLSADASYNVSTLIIDAAGNAQFKGSMTLAAGVSRGTDLQVHTYADLNTMTTAGIFFLAEGFTNGPPTWTGDARNSMLEVMGGVNTVSTADAGIVFQRLMVFGNGVTYTRGHTNNAGWVGWLQLTVTLGTSEDAPTPNKNGGKKDK